MAVSADVAANTVPETLVLRFSVIVSRVVEWVGPRRREERGVGDEKYGIPWTLGREQGVQDLDLLLLDDLHESCVVLSLRSADGEPLKSSDLLYQHLSHVQELQRWGPGHREGEVFEP